MALFERKVADVDLDMHKAKPIKKENRHIVVHFDNAKDLSDFADLLSVTLTKNDKELYYDMKPHQSERLVDAEIKGTVDYDETTQRWEYWWGMPEYISYDKQGYHMIYVYFKDEESKKHFIELVNQPITETTNYIWFPKKEKLSRLAYTWMVEK